ncbi:MAG: 30S ribosomal protein S3 [DPANN group archaeon]|nr:30S ribosomal protein S3 [DPANN group archaeon]
MIERGLVAQRIKEFQIQEYIKKNLRQVGHSKTRVQRTPLGEKIIIHASRPGLIVGKKGANIKKLTTTLKKQFGLENPQIEISEVEHPNLDASIVAESIANSLERFGPTRFKGVGHKTMEAVIQDGALGVEILISGKIPSSRARNWRFYRGYLKKCGDVAISGVSHAITSAHLKSGAIGIQVRIMPPNIELPDKIVVLDEPIVVVEEAPPEEATPTSKRKGPQSRSPAKKASKTAKKDVKKDVKKDAKKDAKRQGNAKTDDTDKTDDTKDDTPDGSSSEKKGNIVESASPSEVTEDVVEGKAGESIPEPEQPSPSSADQKDERS